MTITVSNELSFYDLEEYCWSGAIDTLKKINEYDKEEELMNLLNMVFDMDIPTMTEINDFLWFEDEYIFEELGINDEEGADE